MKLILKLVLCFSMLFCGSKFYAQNFNPETIKYEEIEKKIDEVTNRPEEAWKYIKLYIKKSKAEKNPETLVYAYRYASNFASAPDNLKYADSALAVGKGTNSKKLLAHAYINRGIIYMNGEFYQKALDDILVANKYSEETGDEYNYNKTIYFIAQNKIYLGLYEDANKELTECIKYFKNNTDKSKSLGKDYQTYYLYSLMSLIDSNTKLGKREENKKLLQEAFNYIDQEKLPQYLPYFISSEGTDAYYSKDYNIAISKLSEALRLYNDKYPHLTEIHYLGLSYWKLGKHNVAIKYFEEIDHEYDRTKKLDPQFRSAYEYLIKYSADNNDTGLQLEYINKLMGLDNSYEKNFKYLYTKINKEYDTQKLISEKVRIENSLKSQKQAVAIIVSISLSVFAFAGYRFYRLNKFYKQRFNEIIAENKITDKKEAPKFVSTTNSSFENEKPQQKFDMEFYNRIPGLNPLFVQNILEKLSEFEAEKMFLDTQVTQKQLSEEFGTNSTYLSRIVNTYKEKNFTLYINDLRLDYLLEELKHDSKLVNLDVKELAIMAGFTNTESFSDNFQRKFQIKPSYFVKKMKENLSSGTSV